MNTYFRYWGKHNVNAQIRANVNKTKHETHRWYMYRKIAEKLTLALQRLSHFSRTPFSLFGSQIHIIAHKNVWCTYDTIQEIKPIPTEIIKHKIMLTVSNGSIAFVLEDILVAVCPSVLCNEIWGFLVNPTCAIFVVVVYCNAVWILYASVLALRQGLCTDGIHTRRIDVIVDCPCGDTRCKAEPLWNIYIGKGLTKLYCVHA